MWSFQQPAVAYTSSPGSSFSSIRIENMGDVMAGWDNGSLPSFVGSPSSREASMEELKEELERLRKENELVKKENEDRKRGYQNLLAAKFKKMLTGGWKVIATNNCAEYLAQREADELDNVLFQVAEHHFEFDDNEMSITWKVGAKSYKSVSVKLSELNTQEEEDFIPYVLGNRIKFVYLNGEKLEEYYLEGEQDLLKIESTLNGVTCSRTYEKLEKRAEIPEKERIENKIKGSWVQTYPADASEKVTFNVEDDIWYWRFREAKEFTDDVMGLGNAMTKTVYIDENKIVDLEISVNGEEEVEEWFVKDEKLYYRLYRDGELEQEAIHRRTDKHD